MKTLSVHIDLQDSQKPVDCIEIVRQAGPDDGIECGREAEICEECGYGVCDAHNDPCFAKGCRLHEACREEHFKASGHELNSPTWKEDRKQPQFTGHCLDSLDSMVEGRGVRLR